MDFSVKDFNVRLRTIRLREAIIAMVICFIVNSLFCDFFGIYDPDLEYIFYFVFMILFFIFASFGTRGFKQDFDSLFKGINTFKVIMLAILNMLFAITVSNLLFDPFSSVNAFHMPLANAFHVPLANASMGGGLAFVFELISAVCIAPISEELLFRGVLFNRIKIKKGVFVGMVVSSLLFSLGHFYGPQPLIHVFTSFMFGMLMCVFFLKYDNILMNIAVHLIGNLMLYILDYTPIFAIFQMEPFSMIVGLLALVSLFFIPAYIFYYAVKLK